MSTEELSDRINELLFKKRKKAALGILNSIKLDGLSAESRKRVEAIRQKIENGTLEELFDRLLVFKIDLKEIKKGAT